MEKMNGLDLFSGIGGISLALEEYVKTVAYCEQDRYAQSVLLSRMCEGKLDNAPIWDDVKTLKGDMLPKIDIIFGGFPCQDISVAGNGKGLAGERSGLFFEIVRLTKEIRPTFVFLENVPAIRTRGLEQVIKEFTEMGYDCRWTCLSASSIGAPHRRERWFLLAHAMRDSGRLQCWGRQRQTGQSQTAICDDGITQSLADTTSEQDRRLQFKQSQSNLVDGRHRRVEASWWKAEPDVGRVADGVSFRVDRLKCLGNAVVPFQAKKAFEILMGLNYET